MIGPRWTIPVEAVRAMAIPSEVGIMVRLALRQAQFRPHAELLLVDHRFVAEVTYDDPKYPGRPQQVHVGLSAVVQENMVGEGPHLDGCGVRT